MRQSNYDKYPSTAISGETVCGWEAITGTLRKAVGDKRSIAVELYTGTYEEEIISEFGKIFPRITDTRTLMKPEEEIIAMTAPFMTDDCLFGHVTCLRMEDYFNQESLSAARESAASVQTVIIGSGASLAAPEDALIVYADMARWEIQQRFRKHSVKALGTDNRNDAVSIQYKRGYFNDWRVCDRHKDKLFHKISYWIDTHKPGRPVMIDSSTFFRGIDATASRPFRVVPFFDPAPWGGQWMKEVCDLDRETPNFGWCFDCVPEENSLLLNISGTLFEIPAVDLILLRSREVLGERVAARFGKDFPIRFDFLDTMGGGNLSLQVHPDTQFAYENFGIHYTQDESYYLLDASEDACVYIGLKEGVSPQEMINDLRKAQKGEIVFDAEKYANRIPARKHDHFLIPAGTLHCSGAGAMVLEISSTPNIFTFKLWDWERLGLDGKPRPINVERGKDVIRWERDTDYVHSNLYNMVSTVASGEGWTEERTGLHPNEFIETRRHRFSVPVHHETCRSVNVLNLLEGEEAVISSPEGAFEPFTVHYAETFIIPENIRRYTITPVGGECVTVKAYVRL